jgi:arabinogalactan oligomer/maltooligosaccharide transport system substrate-binding protein
VRSALLAWPQSNVEEPIRGTVVAQSATSTGGELVIGKRFGTTLLMGMALVVSACTSGGGATTAPSSAASAAPSAEAPSAEAPSAELVIWADDIRAKALKPLADQYAAENGVKVTVEAIAKDITTKFKTASKAGTGPDIVVWANDVIGDFVANGTIDPVQLADASGFDPAAIKAMTYQGQLFGIPYSVENIGLYINPDLVKACPTTIEDVVSQGQALVKAKKVKEIMALQVGQKGDAYHIWPLWVSGGGSYFGLTADGDPDPKNVTVDAEGSLAAGAKLKALGEKGVGALKRSIDDKNAIPLFFNKQTPFLFSGPWALGDIKKAGTPYDICPIPPFKDGATATPFIGVNGFYVASQGKNKTLAQDFATSFLTTQDVQTAMYKADPRRPALLASVAEVAANDPDIAKFQAAGKDGVSLPVIPAMGQVWGPFGTAEAAIVGGADVKTSLTAAAEAIRAGIAKQ